MSSNFLHLRTNPRVFKKSCELKYDMKICFLLKIHTTRIFDFQRLAQQIETRLHIIVKSGCDGIMMDRVSSILEF